MKEEVNYIIIGFLTLALIIIFYLGISQTETISFKIIVKVGDYVGFNVDNTTVNFGTIKPGGEGLRNITITNGKAVKEVIIKVEGPIKDWINIDEKQFILNPDESKMLPIKIKIPDNAEKKEYTGELKIILRSA